VRSKTYNSWRGVISRCFTPTDRNWPRYGGVGIKCCERWRSFDAFLEDMGERPAGTSLDRIDNAGNYEPGNCRWATHSEQVRNSRAARYLEHDGRCMIIRDWAKVIGRPDKVISTRLSRGWSVERALST
jgi:hypothetical protein